jgi:hypothetical protein
MRNAANATARGSATKLGSVVAPLVDIDDVNSCRPKPQSHESSPATVRRVLSASGDFRYYVDTRGFQHFNFQQRIWRNPLVQMAVTPVMTTALETLALNLLTYITRDGRYETRVRVTPRRLVSLARRFCAECLLTASPEGWVIPRSTIKAWLVSQQSLRVRARNAVRTRRRVQNAVTQDKKPRVSYTNERSTVQRTKMPARSTAGRK